MEPERRDFRAMMFYDFMRKISVEQSHDNLVEAFQDQAPSKRTVERWYLDFRRERTSLQDEARSGRPSTAVTPETIAAAETLIREDSRINYEQFAETLKIGKAAINTILHDYLGVRRLAARRILHNLSEMQLAARVEWCKFMLKKFKGGESKRVYDILRCDETWIYQYDPETKRQSSIWVFPSEDPPVKVRRARSVGKKMVAAFFCKTGPVAIIPLEDRRTVNADWYINNCLPKAFEALSSRRPKTGVRGLLLHHDNASAHTAAKTLDFLAENSVQLVSHPPYSPDLAPCDFFLFPTINEKIRGIRFESPEEARLAFEETLWSLPEEKWHSCFDSWFHRMQLCIDCCGRYFEKL
ncbi:Histone-lysine N-methyltransferase SETMAR-like [Oopsacas minuta]|uniref:Histone-lysine N-methyltransferase SETMAR-like n=1 Tax=Oopsacas minuta TaxID=111878 RepID=A0AAV7JUN9_9METZ|nr:Histone-lysine N-methyltransferase SETMAR-like [Oopsacas minuta]